MKKFIQATKKKIEENVAVLTVATAVVASAALAVALGKNTTHHTEIFNLAAETSLDPEVPVVE